MTKKQFEKIRKSLEPLLKAKVGKSAFELSTKPIIAWAICNKRTNVIQKDIPIFWHEESADDYLDCFELYDHFKIVKVTIEFK